MEVVSPPTLAEAFRKATIYEVDVKKKGFNPSNNDKLRGKFSFEKKNSIGMNWKKPEWKKDVGERREGSAHRRPICIHLYTKWLKNWIFAIDVSRRAIVFMSVDPHPPLNRRRMNYYELTRT